MKTMKATREYMQYAPIRHYIREEHLEREVALAEGIASFLFAAWELVRHEEPVEQVSTRLAAHH